jgi:hypothetical protein
LLPRELLMSEKKYQLYVSGSPRAPGRSQGDGVPLARPAAAPTPVIRRFPPALQFLTRSDPHVEQQLHTVGVQSFHAGRTLEQVCSDIYYQALSMGYAATIGVQ